MQYLCYWLITLVFFIKSSYTILDNKYLIFDLTAKEESKNTNLISQNILSYLKTNGEIYNEGKNDETIISKDTRKINNKINLYDPKTISINSIDFPNINYKINSIIDKEVIPNNYFYGTSQQNRDNTNQHFECLYENKSPKFLAYKLNSDLHNIITNGKINLALDKNNKIVAFNIDCQFLQIKNNLKVTYQNPIFNSSIPEQCGKLIIADELLYDKLRKFIFCVSINGELIHVFELIHHLSDINSITLRYANYMNISKYNKNTNNINAIAYDYLYFYIAIENNFLIIFDRTYDSNCKVKYNEVKINYNPYEHSKNVLDLLPSYNGVYIVEENKGISFFDLKNLTWNKVIIEHKYIKKLDHVLCDTNHKYSTLFLGAIIENNPLEGVNEFLIEFIINDKYAVSPKINKIFTYNKKLNIDQIITDHINKYTYVLDKNRNELVIINRGIPNFIQTYHYIIGLEQYKNELTDISKIKYLNFFTCRKGYELRKYSLLFEYDDYKVMMKNNSYVTQQLLCNFSITGKYNETIKVKRECLDYDGYDKYELLGCEENVNYLINVQNDFMRIIHNSYEWIKINLNLKRLCYSFIITLFFILILFTVLKIVKKIKKNKKEKKE